LQLTTEGLFYIQCGGEWINSIIEVDLVNKKSNVLAICKDEAQLANGSGSMLSCQYFDRDNLDNFIKYTIPVGWSKTTPQNINYGVKDSILLVSPDFKIGRSGYHESGKVISINRLAKKTNTSLKEMMIKQIADNISDKEKESYLKEITIGGIKGLSGYDNWEGARLFYMVEKENYIWLFTLGQDSSVSKNMQIPEINTFLKSVIFT
jgi:hypothetical protein